MSEEKNKNIDEATGELITNAFSPASTEFGKNIEPAAKAAANIVNISAQAVEAALSPLYILIWGVDQIKAWLPDALARHLKNIPEEKLIVPDPCVAGPSIEALRFMGDKESLRELFATLLATSMNADTASKAHPSYVEIIKQLSSDEALLLKYISSRPDYMYSSMPLVDLQMRKKSGGTYNPLIYNFSDIGENAKCLMPESVTVYIDNLARLKIIDIHEAQKIANEQYYVPLERHPRIKKYLDQNHAENQFSFKVQRKLMRVTDYGKMFIGACISP